MRPAASERKLSLTSHQSGSSVKNKKGKLDAAEPWNLVRNRPASLLDGWILSRPRPTSFKCPVCQSFPLSGLRLPCLTGNGGLGSRLRPRSREQSPGCLRVKRPWSGPAFGPLRALFIPEATQVFHITRHTFI